MLRAAAGGACVRHGVDLHAARVIAYAANAPRTANDPSRRERETSYFVASATAKLIIHRTPR